MIEDNRHGDSQIQKAKLGFVVGDDGKWRKEDDGLYRWKESPEVRIMEEVSPWPLFSESGLSKCPSMAKCSKVSPILLD